MKHNESKNVTRKRRRSPRDPRIETLRHKRADEALRESEARCRAIVSHIPDHILIQDRDLRYSLVINPQLGLSEADMIGKTDWDILGKEDAEKLTAIKSKVMETGEPFRLEMSLRNLKGQTEFFQGTYVPNFDATGKTDSLIGYFRNITDRERAEERMRATVVQAIIFAREEERRQMSSIVHHDVGSLAVGMSGHLDAIEEDLRSGKPGEALKWMKRTRKLFGASVARLKEVAVQLRPPELDALGLRAALRQHFSRVTKHGGTRIHFRETLGRRRVSGVVATTLFRVAQETLTNAIAHGGAKHVDVYLSASKEKVRLTVRDNGKGFSPSGQKGQATSRMGLRVMKEMVAAFEGDFEIHSRRGKGTTVRVTLPLSSAHRSRA